MRLYAGVGHVLKALPFLLSQSRRWRMGSAVVLALVLALSLTAILVMPSSPRVQLQEGDVSPTDVRAPRKIQYESETLTEQARATAARRVAPVYLPPDVRITRQAVKRATEVFETIEWARGNRGASLDDKRAMVRGVAELRDVPAAVLDATLQATDEGWRRIKDETLRVVEAAMRQPIREDQLIDVRRSLPNYISLTLPEPEAAAAAEYATRFILANSVLDEKETQARQREAAAAVAPTTVTIERGEIIVRAGDIVLPRHLEALKKLDLLDYNLDWRAVIGTGLLVALSVFALGLYVVNRNPDFWMDYRRAFLLTLVILAFVILAKLMVPGRTVLPYIFPGAAAAMLLTVLLEPRFALSTTVLLALMVSLMAGRSLELLTYILLGGVVASVSLWRVERLMAFGWAGLYVVLTQLITIASFRLIRGEYDVQGMGELALAAIGGGVLSMSLTTVGYYVLGHMFDLTTSLRLMELARPDQPLLRELQLKAPGSFHHSLVVSNMAESAAHTVGADALLCRVGAYYHDIGKLRQPHMFIENQVNEHNPHDGLDPETSASIILAHSSDGLALARQANLPRSLSHLIAQHHGTTLVRFFYARALERANGRPPDEAKFRYPGPKPQTREAGILMLADSCEAAVRAKRPGSAEEIAKIVAKVVDEKLREGQLEECPLTLGELTQIRAAFLGVLQGVHHPRVDYPVIAEALERQAEPVSTAN